MHLVIYAFTIFATWKWADWKNWQKYRATMLYVAMGNLLYNFLYADHLLWELKPDFFNHTVGEMFYTFIVFPFTAMLYLTKYPETVKGQIFRSIKYVSIYILIEWVYHVFGRIVYNYGWTLWWSLAWDCMMFPMMALHQKKPLICYAASFIMVIIVLMLFPADLK